MDIKQLTYFMAVAQEGSYSKAAEKLGISQPTLSIAVKKLEEELGLPLFYTFNRRQVLTDGGLRLMNGGKQLVDLYQKTVEDVKVTDSHSAGAFTLGLSPLFGACFFGDLIPNFSAAYPNIRITMIEDGANKINQRVEEGTVDLAVTLKTDRTQTYGNCHFSTQRNVALLHKDLSLIHI